MDKLRDSIVQVLDALNADLNLNPTPEARISKLNTWHMALEDLTDEAIIKGFHVIIKEDIKFLPSAGAFRARCKTRQQSNLIEDKEENPYIPLSWEEGKQQAKKILDKLLK